MLTKLVSIFNSDAMPRIFLLGLTAALFFSCSKKEEEEVKNIVPIACFKILQDTIDYQGTIDIKDCSVDANKYAYNLDGAPITLEELLEKKHFSGNRSVTLSVTSETGNLIKQTQEFYVRPQYESFYIPAELPNYNWLLDFGNNPVLESMYAIIKDGGKYYYAAISDDFKISLTEIDNRTKNTGNSRALCSFDNDGTVYVDMPYYTVVSLQRSTHWVNPTTGESFDPISLVNYDFDTGYIDLENKKYSVGANFESENNTKKYIPSINQFTAGSASTLKEFDFGDKSGMIGNFIPYKNGFLAYAQSFDLIWGPDDYDVRDKKALLLELDTDFNLIETHELSVFPESSSSTMGSFNAPFHMMQLPNGRILLYVNGIFQILNNDLTPIHEEILEGESYQSVLLFDDSIILSQGNFIKKFDFEGNLLAKYDYGQRSTKGILTYKENIVFLSEVSSSNTEDFGFGTLFFGMLDKDLNLIKFD